MKVSRITLTPPKLFNVPNVLEWWQYRELLMTLITRSIKVRYKQTFMGASWAIIQPFMTMVVFTVIFGNLAKIPSEGIPYPLYSFIAILPWQFFATALNQGSTSLVGMSGMMTKVYFPRIFAPLSTVLSGLIDLVIAFTILAGLLFYYQIIPSWNILFLPLFILLSVITALSVALWLSGLNVKYRDVKFTLPFVTQMWLYATPIAYPLSVVPEKYQALYLLNPMVAVVEGFRWCILGKSNLEFSHALISAAVILVITLCGLIYFDRVEKNFADSI